MNSLHHPFIMAILFLSTPFLRAQEPETLQESPNFLFDYFYFQEDPVLDLTITTDWGMLVRKKLKEEYQPGLLVFSEADGDALSVNIKLRSRGNVRKKVCYFPPAKVKVPKAELRSIGFSGPNKLKFALQCSEGNKDEDYLLREYLIYQLYEQIHPVHIRTRLVRLRCMEEDREKYSLYALLVEDEDHLALRLKGNRVDKGLVRASGLERDAYLKMCFFQYMISNTDWAVYNRHNLEFVQIPDYEALVPIPYDFDYSGFVNTYYAVPAPNFPIRDVSQRHFMGHKVTEKEALETAAFFLSKKEQILAHCSAFELLNEKSRRNIEKTLTEFFEMMENEKKVVNAFVTGE